MLWKKLHGMTVKTPLGDKVGKVADLVIDLDTWKVKSILIKEGMLKSKHETISPSDVKIEDDHMVFSMESEHTEVEKEISSRHNMYFSDLMKKKVMSSDDEKIGHIYDAEVATDLRNWEIWKVLIRTGFKERRLRLSPGRDLEGVGETIKVKMSVQDVKDKSSPPLPEEESSETEE